MSDSLSDAIVIENIPMKSSTSSNNDSQDAVADEQDVLNLCSSFGLVHSARLLSTSTFEIQFEDKDDAAAAVDNIHGMVFFGAPLRCRFA